MPNGKLHRVKRKAWKKRRRKLIRTSQAIKRDSIENSVKDIPEIPLPLQLSFKGARKNCQHYELFGVCHYRHRCLKSHEPRNGNKSTLLVINWFKHPLLDGLDEIEYSQEDINRDFKAFYEDIASEILPNSRKVVVAGNRATYLRGNVYIEFESVEECNKRFRALHGRWYGGKRVHCELICTPSWNRMLCRLHRINKCKKGFLCYFVHGLKLPKS